MANAFPIKEVSQAVAAAANNAGIPVSKEACAFSIGYFAQTLDARGLKPTSGAAASVPKESSAAVNASSVAKDQTILVTGSNSLPTISYICSALDGNVWWDKHLDEAENPSSQPCLSTPRGEVVGDIAIARCLASPKLYGPDALAKAQIDQWIDFAHKHFCGVAIPEAMVVLDDYLRMRTFLAGYSLSLADIVVFVSLSEAGLKKHASALPHLTRWINYLSSISIVQTGAGKLRSMMSRLKQKKKVQERMRSGDMYAPLPDAVEGKVVTRFPPEPSGYLHIGHAKAAFLNAHYAKKYKGKLLIRFDDTNPEKEKAEYIDNITRDLKTLGIVGDMVSHTSDHFETIEKYARKMIKGGLAYMDDSTAEEMKAQRDTRTNAPRRDATPKENMELFDQLLKGTDKGKVFCLRAKIDMQSDNGTMQDPVMYRYKGQDHPKTGKKYKAYPTYDFSCPIVDSLEGVTHALRTTEYRDRNFQTRWFVKAMKLRPYNINEYGKLNFAYTALSKRKLKKFVETGEVRGWDDARMPTIQGMLRRGVHLDSLREFILSQGFSTKVVTMEWDKYWSTNAKLLDKIAPRYMAISANAVKFVLSDVCDTPRSLRVPLFPKDPSKGYKSKHIARTILLEPADAALVKEGEEITLMRLGNAIVEKVVTVDGVVTEMHGRLNPKGDFRKTKLKLTWLAQTDFSIPVKIFEFDHLITKIKLDDGDDINDFLTSKKHPTEQISEMRGEAALRLLRVNDKIQIERRGFFRVDTAFKEGGALDLFLIPDGKKRSMSALASKTSKITHR